MEQGFYLILVIWEAAEKASQLSWTGFSGQVTSLTYEAGYRT
jgi:hypothetical protein